MSKLKNRQKVSGLIISVLTNQTTVRSALLEFPSDRFDQSIECAWHALLHYEADEDLRAKDIEYKEEQDEYLYFISDLFKDGRDLPANIVKGYKDFYGGIHVSSQEEEGFWAKLLRLLRFINIH